MVRARIVLIAGLVLTAAVGVALVDRAYDAGPSHAPGYVVPGRDAWVTRVVMLDGVELFRDTWYSHYAPVWGGPLR